MADIIVNAQRREGKGKGPARRLRQQGLIPAVVYGRKQEPTHLAVDPSALLKAIETPHKFNTLLTLKLDGSDKHVLFKDWAVDPVSRKLEHADFLEVSLEEPVKVDVPVVTTGRAAGQAEGGILSLATHEIVLEALPAKIPVRIEVDVTNLKIGASIHVSELTPPEGCKFKFTTDYVIAFVAVPEKEEVVAPVAAAVPGAAPAEGAAAPAGAAPAAAGAAAPAAEGKKPEAKGAKK
ncbi:MULTISPECIES: 50S ribosomal protein L25/general stress protein Ctc [Anaeromyxobacter]|uniref:50S ribosomal protein L25/general stress protein Ctc n=1 Tax=Anaeromyxobacter TaxID=161492 RepID=UPI001F593D65|nr:MULTISPECIES: 50S ribosomal protein L25/general stress protein Ctc [unclassified Anaeromyxobacter]